MPEDVLPKTVSPTKGAHLERERLNSLINSMSDGVIAIDHKGKVILYNAAALYLLDRNTSIQNQYLADVLPLFNQNGESVDVSDLIKASSIPVNYRDFRIKYDSDSSIANLFLSISPVRSGYGKSGLGGYVVLLRDITREKSLEEERDEFISVASHELRTPIAIAEGSVSNGLFIISKGGSVNQVVKVLEETHRQVLFLTDLINDLSTLSRAESGKLPVYIDKINAHDLITELEGSYRKAIEAKALVLKIEIDPKLEILHSSRLYVKEILQNFITNAIKYTSTGSITVIARSQTDGVKFEVEDTGIGISKSDRSMVFTKFFRSEDFRTRQSTGTGLGLYISEKLANLISAKITLTSKLNHGSSFSVLVPNIKAKNHMDNA